MSEKRYRAYDNDDPSASLMVACGSKVYATPEVVATLNHLQSKADMLEEAEKLLMALKPGVHEAELCLEDGSDGEDAIDAFLARIQEKQDAAD